MNDPLGELPPWIGDGLPFTTSYRVDPSAVFSTGPIAPDGILYGVGSPKSDLRVEAGDEELAAAFGSVIVSDDGDWSGLPPLFTNGDAWLGLGAGGGLSYSVYFVDDTGTRVAGESFFLNDSLTGWTVGEVAITSETLGQIIARGTLLSGPAPAAVPALSVPGRAAVLLLLLALGIAYRRVDRTHRLRSQ